MSDMQIARTVIALLRDWDRGWRMTRLRNGLQPIPGTRAHFRKMRREMFENKKLNRQLGGRITYLEDKE